MAKAREGCGVCDCSAVQAQLPQHNLAGQKRAVCGRVNVGVREHGGRAGERSVVDGQENCVKGGRIWSRRGPRRDGAIMHYLYASAKVSPLAVRMINICTVVEVPDIMTYGAQ